MAIQQICHPGVWIRVVAERMQIPFAEKTSPTGDAEWNYNPVTLYEIFDLGPGLNNLAHKFVTEDVTFLHRGNVPIIQMKIGTADRGETHPNDRVVGIDNLRLRYIRDFDLVFTRPNNGTHSKPPAGARERVFSFRFHPPTRGVVRLGNFPWRI